MGLLGSFLDALAESASSSSRDDDNLLNDDVFCRRMEEAEKKQKAIGSWTCPRCGTTVSNSHVKCDFCGNRKPY